jgi:hypothetical protein
MEWEFTPEDVVKGRADYGLEEFRRDLAAEVRQNLGEGEAAERAFHLLYDLCYALATNKEIEAHLAAYAYDPPTVQFLREMVEPMADNVEMLGAILQRQIMDRIAAGMPLEAAIDEVADWHRQVVSGTPPHLV